MPPHTPQFPWMCSSGPTFIYRVDIPRVVKYCFRVYLGSRHVFSTVTNRSWPCERLGIPQPFYRFSLYPSATFMYRVAIKIAANSCYFVFIGS